MQGLVHGAGNTGFAELRQTEKAAAQFLGRDENGACKNRRNTGGEEAEASMSDIAGRNLGSPGTVSCVRRDAMENPRVIPERIILYPIRN
jgi:hypothetical protein